MGNKLLVPRILWFALFLSTFIYLYVLDVTMIEGERNWERLLMGLSVAAVASGVASLFAPRLLVRPGPTRSKGGPADDRYVTGLILAMALAEAVAIYGMVLGFKGAPWSVVLPFFVATWILMLIRFPTEAKIREST